MPSAKYTKDGTAFILRLKEPLDTGLAIKAGGARLIQTIPVVKQQSDDLKTEIAERLTQDQTYRTDLATFRTTHGNPMCSSCPLRFNPSYSAETRRL